MYILLNGAHMLDRDSTHKYLKTKLSLSKHYGMNLDALWDELSSTSEDLYIKVINTDLIKNNLGDYGSRLIKLFKDLENENKNIEISC